MEGLRPEVAVFLAFAAWVGMLTVIARAGGWAALAQVYQSAGDFEGRRWWFQTGQMGGGIRYGGILTVGANLRGLYLSVLVPFRFGHPPLFIPWTDITVTARRGLVLGHVDLRFRRVPGVSLRLPERLGRQIAEAAGPSWPQEPAE